jgi:lipopolysaccharide transport system permease protein
MSSQRSLQVQIYTPESKVRKPKALLGEMFGSLWDSRELAWRLFVRDLSAQYRQSILGVFWSFLPPIITGLVFILLQNRGVVNLGETGIPYPVFALTGTILWQVFVESLNAPLKSVLLSKPIIAKVNIPYEALVVASFYMVCFSAAIKYIIILGILILFAIPLTWGVVLGLIGVLGLIILGIACGLFITPFGLLYTDVSSGLPLVTQLWFFVTPVVYMLPLPILAIINPVTPLLVETRDLITTGSIDHLGAFSIVFAGAIALLLLAWIIYRIAIPIIIERISA